MAKQLLIDWIPFHVSREQINESLRLHDGRLIVKGILQRAGTQNQNGRVYPKPILEREVKKYQENFVKQKRALGELDHPDSAVVELQNVSHNVIEMQWKGSDLMGVIEVLSTPAGNIVKELFRNGIVLGISSRGVGTVQEVFKEGSSEPAVEVQDDFELIAFDFVSNPSTHGAFLSPINEGKISHLNTSYAKAHQIINSIICDVTCKCSVYQ